MKTLDPWKERGLKMAEDLPRRVNGYLVTQPKRWTKADNGRLLPLNSAAWAKLRKSVLNGEPLCRHCAAQGLTVPATEVDHMHGAWDNRIGSLQPLCKSCHSRKTMAEMHGKPARLGCDASGNPTNPMHHWNQAAVARSGGLAAPSTESQEIASDRATDTDLYPLF